MELYIAPAPRTRNAVNGRILPGYVPKNKGLKWGEYNVSKASRKKILANLTNEGRLKGAYASKPLLCKKIVGVQDGAFFGAFESAAIAELKLRDKGIAIRATNIRDCCKGIRPRAGGIQWFYEKDFEVWSSLIVDSK